MKKATVFIVFLFISCDLFAQTDSVVFDIYNSFFAQTYARPGCPEPTRVDIPGGSAPQTIFGYQWQGVTGDPGAAYYGKNPLVLDGINNSPPYVPSKYQDGFTIKYPFKSGYRYDIVVDLAFADYDPHSGPHPPALQMQLTNTPNYTYGRDCLASPPTTNAPDYDLTQSSNPWAQFVNAVGIGYHHDFVLSPTSNYAYIWLNAKTNETIQNAGSILINKIVIHETLNINIAGNSAFCDGTINSYQLNQGDALYPNKVTWSSTGEVKIIATNNAFVNVTNTDANGGTGSLTATVTNGSVTNTIYVGKQPLVVNATVDRTPQPSKYQYLTATATQIPGTTTSNYTWYLVSNGQPTTQIGNGFTLSHYPLAPCSGTVYYCCQAVTPCGTVTNTQYAYNTNCGGSSPMAGIVAYPNPASSELNVAVNEAVTTQPNNVAKTPSKNYRVILYDNKGQILRSSDTANKKCNLNIADIPNGTYYLHVIDGDNVVEKQIIIKH